MTPLVIRWDHGEAFADECDWVTEANRHIALCAADEVGPRCYGAGLLGPVRYGSDSMLATIQESLGRCEEMAGGATPSGGRFAARFVVDVAAEELVATSEVTGAPECLPLRETLCQLSPPRPPAAKRSRGVAAALCRRWARERLVTWNRANCRNGLFSKSLDVVAGRPK